jgi:phosphoenolpyruvate phosphomutase
MEIVMNRAQRKRQQLRDGLKAATPVVMVGAHDAMSGMLIESYGFDAVWVSGFGVSTMGFALPDLNLITMTDTLAATVRIDAATVLPVVADCDNGFGGLSNLVRTVREFERAGISGICVEDNLFPKRNSLYQGAARRELVDVEEQARRIAAGKAAQDSADFVVVARVEALIAGHGVDAACERADAYAAAGADAILIHSKDRTLGEIEGFLSQWKGLGSTPLVAVPTLFPDFTAEELHAKGFQVIILANHPMRAAVKAMEDTLETLRRERRAAAVDGSIAQVDHVFDLVGTKEAIEQEDGPAAGQPS